MKVGDLLQFDDTLEYLEIIDLSHYPRFQIMLEQEGLKHVLPGIQSIDTGVAIYHQFYTPAQKAEFGVVAIHIKRKEI